MQNGLVETLALPFLTALITPAILILACASLISSCLMRLARVMDRVRAVAQLAEDIRVGKCTDHVTERRQEIDAEFHFYERRAKVILVGLALLYGTVGLFVATSIGVAVGLLFGGPVAFLPVTLSVVGISLFLLSSLMLLYENRLAFQSMQREIQFVHMLEERVFHPADLGTRTAEGTEKPSGPR